MKQFLRTFVMQTAASLQLDEVMLARLHRRSARNNRLVFVVEMHETLAGDADRLRRQIEWVAEHFTLISPDTFFSLWDRTQTIPQWSKPPIMFTFDDGRESNYSVAAPVLEAFGTRGLFFVVPDFIGLTAEKAKQFYYSKIDIRGMQHSESAELWTPMNPDQLADLSHRGHAIGNHTLSHVNLAALSKLDLEKQIIGAANKISSWIGKEVEAFAWPFAWNAITGEAWEIIRKTHRFCCSPCPGTTDCTKDSPHLIWRTEVESYYSEAQFRFMYSGLANPIWSTKRRHLHALSAA